MRQAARLLASIAFGLLASSARCGPLDHLEGQWGLRAELDGVAIDADKSFRARSTLRDATKDHHDLMAECGGNAYTQGSRAAFVVVDPPKVQVSVTWPQVLIPATLKQLGESGRVMISWKSPTHGDGQCGRAIEIARQDEVSKKGTRNYGLGSYEHDLEIDASKPADSYSVTYFVGTNMSTCSPGKKSGETLVGPARRCRARYSGKLTKKP